MSQYKKLFGLIATHDGKLRGCLPPERLTNGNIRKFNLEFGDHDDVFRAYSAAEYYAKLEEIPR